ncbi:MAG TPA: DNA repair protein RecN [Spirochaetota bacterium]|jgi:DNA repair protein RecN (Recombination protein N)|nr:DNA repair protein RecN [Spirochaetota bacterium]HOK91541.1 DNA repair protein RecN [Spirochaetota bacterium]HPD76971.1 DNA repair protein RecN [Spirochaetota bacterium]HPP94171.1 DNA repair protein RecN [Spirochaetota bacterium]HRS61608.1 DNA repair protein RecN [Spirochaetota bacterium]
MLLELRIKNFVIIDSLNISFTKGLNILSGETGAGKSILIDALSGVLGEKLSTDMIRTGFDKATLEAVFDISSLEPVQSILQDSGIDIEDDQLILRREIFANGKGRCFANSVQITVAKLKEIADSLVDIHGQNEHQTIINIARHRELLDSFGNLQNDVAKVKDVYDRLYNIRNKLNSFEIDEREKARRIEFNSFAIKEIESASLKPGEEEELKNESNLLANAEKIFKEVNEASQWLSGEGGAIQSLKKAEISLSKIADIDPNVSSLLDKIREALYSLEDSSSEIKSYKRNIDFSPERINEVESRLNLIQGLKKKYGNTIEEILQYAEKAKSEIEAINSSDEEIESLKVAEKKTVKEAKELALALSEKRKAAAARLEELVMNELKDLGMAGAVFKISIKREVSPDGDIENENNRYVLYPHGMDRVEFMLSANEGEDLRQLRKVASGGEMSRIMLAIKNVIQAADIVDTLIFDEVDAGISGKTAEIVGRKLKNLSKNRQVLLITHLPQIAAMSDTHFLVQKGKADGRVTTVVKQLPPKDKIREVARMLAGEEITELSIKHAEEMIEKALHY